MADKKVDATTGEVQGEEWKEQGILGNIYTEPAPIFRVHCKPVFNYQSVEFDWVFYSANKEEELSKMEQFYSKMLEMLVRVSQNAPQVEAKKPVAPVEEPASEKQKEILRNFHIDFKPDITKKQAHALIKKSMDQEIF